MRDFDFVEPASVSEACLLLSEDPEGSLVFAGALDIFDRPRGEMLWMLTLDFARYVRARQERSTRTTLFGPTASLPPPPRSHTMGSRPDPRRSRRAPD